MSELGLLLLLAQTLRIAAPLALASIGGVVSERSGIVNIALEGMLLMGAFGYALGASAGARILGVTEQDVPVLTHLAIAACGIAGALAGGLFIGAIHAIVTVVFRADQVVSGVALNILAAGLSKFLLKLTFGSSSNSSWIHGMPEIPGLSAIPVVGSAIGAPLVWIAVIAVVGVQALLFTTVWGLRTRAVGENPGAAESAGIAVKATRIRAVLLCGALASLGGAWLAADQHQFTEGMSAGRGYIALAALIFGKWRPTWAAGACLLFAAAESLQIQLQGTGFPVPTPLLQVLPHLLALAVLAGLVGKATPPSSTGKPWPEEA